jgi:uncharacterized protein YecE (DUF72 family)
VKPRAYVGCSGWNYKHWRESIYPPKLTQKRWLSFMADHFDTVEVNTSFYRIPKRETVIAWQESTPERFKFALKLWRGITHYRKLMNSGEFTRRFLEVADALDPVRRAPLLIQLPPNQGKDIDKLRLYLDELKGLFGTPWKVAVEFRNDAWLTPEVYRMLDDRRVALCIHDMIGRAATRHPNDVDFVYVRRHGTADGRYAGSYSRQQIEADADQIRKWLNAGKSAYIYFNNDIGGHAFRNAEALRFMIDVT